MRRGTSTDTEINSLEVFIPSPRTKGDGPTHAVFIPSRKSQALRVERSSVCSGSSKLGLVRPAGLEPAAYGFEV